MTTLSFFARGDASSANNAALNIQNTSQQPTVLITFDSGPTGDIILEANGGAPDPDTTVTIDGQNYSFIVEQTGDLPAGNNKVPDVLEGSQITVISVIIDGTYERFFFVTDGSGSMALMNQFGNGAVALQNTDTTPPDVLICFCGDTDILTPQGARKVDALKTGDLVLTGDGDAVPILWIGRTHASVEDMRCDPSLRPICISANSVQPGAPYADLYVSAQHRVVLESAWAEFYFGEPGVMMAAKHMVGTAAERIMPERAVAYFHILLDRHAVLISNGLLTESFQPSRRSIGGMSARIRRSLVNNVSPKQMQALLMRPDAMRTLRAYEARTLSERMFAGTAQPKPTTEGNFLAA
ncbi:Hint domain-containing protein [Jannaschia faecimaris]|uniref:Hint domain-containing protein n=1 Tax=Jannaschia faecimaris TaxID=1244108 RepID=A0A1H3R1A9_9RHOB|nr:Hint domain-containing protein [Jannaschia faecimaris]SDZ19612.1 Hint domain-containing protein [Jannaschia faecimaris]